MLPPSPILADVLGLLLGLVFLLLLGLAIVSSLQRKQEAEHRRRIRAELERRGKLPPAPPPQGQADWPILRDINPSAPRRPARVMQAPPPPRRVVPAQQRRKVKSARSAPPLLPVEARRLPSIPSTTATSPAAPLPSIAASKPAANAATLARWLTPQTLQSQFILTEILQPPLALRENHLQS